MEQLNKHQVYTIVAIVFLFMGGLLHYVLVSPTISDKVEAAYQQGREDELKETIDNFNWADSIVIKEDRIVFYKIDTTQIK